MYAQANSRNAITPAAGAPSHFRLAPDDDVDHDDICELAGRQSDRRSLTTGAPLTPSPIARVNECRARLEDRAVCLDAAAVSHRHTECGEELRVRHELDVEAAHAAWVG
jgi:hypothetical protein